MIAWKDAGLCFLMERSVNSKSYCSNLLLENLYCLFSLLKFFCCLSGKQNLDYLLFMMYNIIWKLTLTDSKHVYRKLGIKMANAIEMPCLKFRAHSLLTDHYSQT